MLSRAFYPDEVKQYDTDDKPTWFAPNTRALSAAGVLEGSSFQSAFVDAGVMNQNISRFDMAKLMTNIMAKKGSSATESQMAAAQTKIADLASIPDQYQDAVRNVYALGIIGGYSDGSFNGSGSMTRGAGTAVIYRMLQFAPAGTPSGQTLANGKAITEENVLAIIQELLKEYPAGTTWDGKTYRTGTASIAMRTVEAEQITASGLRSNVQGGCGGFASLVSDRIFGSGNANPARKVPVEQVRPGDVIIKRDANGNHLHYAIAASRITGIDEFSDVLSPVLTIYDGNVTGKVRYSDRHAVPKTYSERSGYYVEIWTRYPTDNPTPWTGPDTGSSGSGATAAQPNTGSNANKTCDLCGGTFTSWALSPDLTRRICNNCYGTPEGRNYIEG